MKILNEFKQFALRGNVIDLAIGVVIGAGFGKIVTSLVNDIIMPPFGFLISGIDFSKWKIILKHAVTNAQNEVVSPAIEMNVGSFANTILQFVIIAIAIFLLIKAMNQITNKAKKEEEKKEPSQPVLSNESKLLIEIRDLLKEKGDV